MGPRRRFSWKWYVAYSLHQTYYAYFGVYLYAGVCVCWCRSCVPVYCGRGRAGVCRCQPHQLPGRRAGDGEAGRRDPPPRHRGVEPSRSIVQVPSQIGPRPERSSRHHPPRRLPKTEIVGEEICTGTQTNNAVGCSRAFRSNSAVGGVPANAARDR